MLHVYPRTDHKIQTLFPRTRSLKHRAKVALAFSRRSDSRVHREFREQEKKKQGRREGEEGRPVGLVLKTGNSAHFVMYTFF